MNIESESIVGSLLGLFRSGRTKVNASQSHYTAGRIVQTGRMSAKDLHDNLMGGLPTSNGHWTGEAGNSCWLPDRNFTPKNRLYNNMYDKTWGQILRENHCEQGIVFTNGEIDFARTGVVKAEVEIPGGIGTCFSEIDLAKGKRTRLHDKAFERLALQMGKTVEEVMKWKDENVYVWHECIDLKTLQLVPREIHDNVTHQGGVAILKASGTATPSSPSKETNGGLLNTLLKIFGCTLLVLMFTSCQKDERMLKKFVSRFNAGEYEASSAYIYDEDLTGLAFFCREVRSKNEQAFLKIENQDYEDDIKGIVVNMKWENANETLRRYFANIGRPLSADGELLDTIHVYETTDGDKLSFNWGIPHTAGNKLMMAEVKSDNDKVQAVNIRLTPDGKIINTLRRGERILADKSSEQGDSYPVYWVSDKGDVEQGFVKARLLDLTDTPYFSMGIFSSMSLLVALILAVVILLPLFLLRALFTNPILALIGLGLLLVCLFIFYECIEKILFELFIINLPY